MPPVWPSPRPLIFPNGTPQAATIGPTAREVLSPTPPVECLSTTLRPSAERRSSVSPLRIIASVSANVSAAIEPAEVDGHQERGHLVVGDLAARIAEHQLGELRGRELPAVALALDHLGRVDHEAVSATKTATKRDASSGPSNLGRSSARWERVGEAAT